MKYIVFMCHTIKILTSNWPRTRKCSHLLQAGKTVAFDFANHGHALVTLYFQFLCSDWSKFDRWVHAENLCSILKLVYFDSWSWQRFGSTCDVFNRLSPLDVQNEIQLLSRVFCYSWLVCLLGFWLKNAASWNLFTLTAEADRVLCQLVMFLTVFLHWMYKMKFSCYRSFWKFC